MIKTNEESSTPIRVSIYKWLLTNGPATRSEICMSAYVSPVLCQEKLDEMIVLGNVIECGDLECSITGKTAAAYSAFSSSQSDEVEGELSAQIYIPRSCGDCPLVIEEDDGSNVCLMRPSLTANPNRRPVDCDLDRRDFIIRGKR